MRNLAKLSVRVSTVVGLVTVIAFAMVRTPGLAADSRPTVSKTIAIDGARFDPVNLSVPVGGTVKWINKDPYPHNVTSKIGGFQSGNLDPNREWRFRASKRGTFEYVCTLHPGMKAVLHVK
jgi:plastocyanin